MLEGGEEGQGVLTHGLKLSAGRFCSASSRFPVSTLPFLQGEKTPEAGLSRASRKTERFPGLSSGYLRHVTKFRPAGHKQMCVSGEGDSQEGFLRRRDISLSLPLSLALFLLPLTVV